MSFRHGEVVDAHEFRRRMEQQPTKRDKYGRSKDTSTRRWNGRTYASKAEMRYAQQLFALRDAGHLRLVLEQPRLWLGVAENVCVPDFLVIEAAGEAYFVDVKGSESESWKRQRRLWRQYGPLPLRVVSSKTLRTVEVISAK